MPTPTRRRWIPPVGIALAVLLALPMATFANSSGAIAQTGGMTATLPMLGSSLTVAVTLDDVGNVTEVNLDPVGTYEATKLGPHAVTFKDGDGGSVKIRAKGDKLSIGANAGSLAALLGSGTWSADVFGTGDTTTVDYTVGEDAGAPTIAIDAVAALPGDVVVDVGTPETESGPDGSSASAKVAFSRDGYTKTLKIVVELDAEGDHPASLKITLSGKDRQKLIGETLAELVGTHSWSGHLCDGTPVGVTYDVLEDGSLALGSVDGAPATIRDGKHIKVRFDGTKSRVKVSLHAQDDGSWSLTVKSKADKCKHTPAADPTVNTPVGEKATKGGDRHGPKKSGGTGDDS